MMDRKELAQEVVSLAIKAGATAAEVIAREGTEFSTSVRLGSVEKLLQASFRKLGVRLFFGTRAAVSATSDFSFETLRQVVQDTLSIARLASEDPASGLPSEDLYLRNGSPRHSLCFPEAQDLPAQKKIEQAIRCEEASLQFDHRINNSEGAGFSDSITHVTYANSLGVSDGYSKTVATLFSSPLAEFQGQKQRDYWFSSNLDLSKLQSPEEVGKEAARRALRRLGARKVSTCEVPVVFDPLTAASLVGHVAEAVSGTALLRKASFLTEKLGTKVASPLMTIVDDAWLRGGLGSRPFDSEGIPSQTTVVVEEGTLSSYLLDSYAARKLGMRTTGSSARELSGAPLVGSSNFHLKPGNVAPEEIIATVKKGLYVTEVIGFGVDIVSGNYSQGAAGIWIENGRLTYPVEEITIAGNLRDMLQNVEAVGNDIQPLAETFAPTLKIGKMVISGN